MRYAVGPTYGSAHDPNIRLIPSFFDSSFTMVMRETGEFIPQFLPTAAYIVVWWASRSHKAVNPLWKSPLDTVDSSTVTEKPC